jgi:hypothetical protein
MLLLVTALALAAAPDALPGAATFVAPVPNLTDLDLLPEPGDAWPCVLDVQVDGMGAQKGFDLESGCPSGLKETARQMGTGWAWATSEAARTEKVSVAFRVLSDTEAEPKATSKPQNLVFFVRPYEVLPMPTAEQVAGPKGTQVPAWTMSKVPELRLPKSALSAAVIGGSCLVRMDIGPDGKVTKARVNRCLDALAEPALAAAKKVEFKLAPGAQPPKQIDLAVGFEAAK